jgi:DNA-3-methyladenine glycosylase I
MTRTRCEWPAADPLMLAYHDTEWGVPLYDDRRQFEFLVLETMQAGLSWRIVLGKRDGMRRAFEGFDPERVARFDARRVRRLLQDAGIIRNRLKVEAAVANARAFLRLRERHGTVCRFLWTHVGGRPIINSWRSVRELPATSPASDQLSRALKAEGFKFVGSTVVYAHMQATGMVNDHVVTCFRHRQVQRMVRRLV